MNWFADLMAQVRAEQERQSQQQLAEASQQPIPGLTGPVSAGTGIPGFIPGGTPGAPGGMPGGMPPSRIPRVPPQSQFTASGPYGQQAMQLAGLLASPQAQPPVQPMPALPGGMPPGAVPPQTVPQRPVMGGGLLGEPTKGRRIPMYRPPGK